ncbi:hypothetical protein B0H13DRAFT_2007083 [Mycena leptocephala]|nr:hypothetical protein B0H13DRAFT_2007083 [Mycena leptocephala]
MPSVRFVRLGAVQNLLSIWPAFKAAVGRLDKSLSPMDNINKLRRHKFTKSDSIYISTCSPVFAWLLEYFTSRFIPKTWRPDISVALLPALESVLYGANISDILTRFTHPILDFVAWMPYGLLHFVLPFVVAAFVWLFRPKELVFPCAAPWYEVIHGLTPANYGMSGSPGGLLRIDRLFHGSGYTIGFSNAPVVFGAFPSLHAGCATMEAIFVAHFFPQATRYVWGYTAVLYWATMYLSHHYLIDVVAGACLSILMFYLFLPDEFRDPAAATAPAGTTRGGPRSKYEIYDLEAPLRGNAARRQMMTDTADFDLSESSQASDEEEVDIAYRHRHTASIASLIREGERGPEEAWNPSPIGATFFEAAGEIESGKR